MTRLLGVLTLLLTVGLAGACPPVVVRHNAYQAHVVTPVVAVQAVAVAIPLYTAAYGADPSAALLAEVKLLRAEIQMQALKAENDRLRAAPARPVPGAPAIPPVVEQATAPATAGALVTACAQCHSGAAAKGGVKLFDGGKRLQLSGESLGDSLQAVVDGRMPKGRKLSADDRLAVLADLMK